MSVIQFKAKPGKTPSREPKDAPPSGANSSEIATIRTKRPRNPEPDASTQELLTQSEESLAFPRGMPYVDFSQIVVLKAAANPDKSDPIMSFGSALKDMESLVQMFGFDRLPQTYGELYQLHEFCRALRSLSGFNTTLKHIHLFQKANESLWESYFPGDLEAFLLYCKKDMAGLRDYLKRTDALTRIGKNFEEFIATPFDEA